MIALIPTLISLAGLGAGAWGLASHSVLLLLVSLALDIADGESARQLGCVTDAGAWLDRTIDATLAGAIGWSAWHPLIVLPVIWTQYTRNRFSGRALVTGAAIIAWSLRG